MRSHAKRIKKMGSGSTPEIPHKIVKVVSEQVCLDDKIHVRNLWTEIYDEKGDLIDNIGTWVTKQWGIAVSPQGYVSITDITD